MGFLQQYHYRLRVISSTFVYLRDFSSESSSCGSEGDVGQLASSSVSDRINF